MTASRPTSGDEIRAAFLAFFQERGHLLVPSASLVPAGDPTLLLTNAGMVQFKPYFTGDEQPPSRRLTSVQKCFRTTDIDSVGDDTHLTFFEMLGNFSVGDYFKREAIAWAWEFATQVLDLPPERIWATVFLDDDEAHGYWSRDLGVPDERIVRCDEKDNFWGPAGAEGPCGPCSELHYDLYPERGLNGERPNDDSGRFVEFWNLVFMQYYQHPDGSRTPLPAPNIDTGMGLERTTAIVHGVDSVYETDLLAPIVERVSELAGVTYGRDTDTDYAIRVVAEHARSATFLIADGVAPGNEGRGYVLRRIIRRGIRYARKLGADRPSIGQVAEMAIDCMSVAYPDLTERRSFVLRTIDLEDDQFNQAITLGTPVLREGFIAFRRGIERSADVSIQTIVADPPMPPRVNFSKSQQEIADDIDLFTKHYVGIVPSQTIERASSLLHESLLKYGMEAPAKFLEDLRTLSGPEAFLLYDTYGFPLELTQEIAREHGLGVDVAGFEAEMEAQRQRGRASGHFGGDRDAHRAYEALGSDETRFVGYETLDVGTVVAGMLVDGSSVERAEKGNHVEVVLRETPFYAEGGGQVGDTGVIQCDGGRLEVRDTQRPVAGVIAHVATVTEGTIAVGDMVRAQVDAPRRADVIRNHTATHLLHQALREVLGTHVRQAGSLVAQTHLRFDFAHLGPVTPDELDAIQKLVNDVIRQNLPAQKRETTYGDAIAGGALAFFGDRYPDRVRVLEIGEFSYEVCGGTHVDRSGDIGAFRITGESGIGTGLRRIEAVTGRGADQWLDQRMEWLDGLARLLHTTPAEASQRVESLVEEVERSRRTDAASQRDDSRRQAEALLEQVQVVDGVSVVAAQVSVPGMETLREMGDRLRDRMGSGIVVLGSVFNDRPAIVAMVTPDLVSRGYKAGEIVKAAAQRMGGGGGGKPEVAQAGGKEPDRLPAALEAAMEAVRRQGM
jgi:alanyl-tRNA synthetase